MAVEDSPFVCPGDKVGTEHFEKGMIADKPVNIFAAIIFFYREIAVCEFAYLFDLRQ